MRRFESPINVAFLVVFALFIGGCQSAKPPEVVLDPINSPVSIKDQAVSPQSDDPQHPESFSAYAEVQAAAGQIKGESSANEIASVLMNIDEIVSSGRVPAQDVAKINDIESAIVSKLRIKVKNEVYALHDNALKSQTYQEGYAHARNAEAVLMLYPLSEESSVVKEAELLSSRQKEVLRRLEQIRIQRYNNWAAKQAEKALRNLRKNKKYSADAALTQLKPIEPKLLEPAVDQLYRYCLTEIMDKYDKDEKATVAKELSSPSVSRKGLEEF